MLRVCSYYQFAINGQVTRRWVTVEFSDGTGGTVDIKAEGIATNFLGNDLRWRELFEFLAVVWGGVPSEEQERSYGVALDVIRGVGQPLVDNLFFSAN